MKKITVAALFILVVVLNACNSKTKEENTDSNPANDSLEEIVTSNDTLNSDGETLAKESKTLADVYKQLQKKPQSFTVPTSKDTTIICAEGTKIKIKANSFIDEKTKQPVTASVKISVTEYYKVSDIILAKLSTTTDGKILETGGMLNITASSNNQNSILKKGGTIGIEFPSKTKKDGMGLYNGLWKNENNINWTLDRNAGELNQIFTKVDEQPTFPGGIAKFYRFISTNLSANKDGTILISFVVDKSGNVSNAKIIRGINKYTDKQALALFNRLPKFIPGKLNGEVVNTLYTLPIRIEGSITEEQDELIEKVNIEEKYNENTIQYATRKDINSYLFNSSKLGWINCDKLWRDNSAPAIDYIVDVNIRRATSVNIIFHEYRSVLNGYFDSDQYTFAKMPANEKITVVAVQYIDNKVQLAVKETEISDKGLNDLVFKPVTFELLKEELRKIDKI